MRRQRRSRIKVAPPDGTAVTILRSADVPTIYPTKAPVSEMIRKLKALPAPDTLEIRDVELIPERPNL